MWGRTWNLGSRASEVLRLLVRPLCARSRTGQTCLPLGFPAPERNLRVWEGSGTASEQGEFPLLATVLCEAEPRGESQMSFVLRCDDKTR